MEQDERTKKLLAGKEKLAAFQKKRAKRKKKKDTDDSASDYTWSESSSVADLSDVASTGDFSDTGSVIDEESTGRRRGGVLPEVALVRAENKLGKASDRIMELEESLQGKEDAIARILEENDQLRADLAVKNTMESPADPNTSVVLEERGSTPDKERDDTITEDSYQHKLEEFDAAIKQRDEVISQLTENLRATTASRDTLQQEYTAQAADLARQVQTLQLQLQQSGDWLKNHMGEHGISAQALLEAKNEVLALQQVNSHKEQELSAMRSALLERDQALLKVVEQYKTAAEQANLLHKEYTRLQGENQQFTITVNQLTTEIVELRNQNGILQQEKSTVVQSSSSRNTNDESNAEIVALQKAMCENLARIQSLEAELTAKTLAMAKLGETVTQKDQSLQQMALALSSVGSNSADTSNDDADNLQWTISQQKEEITSLQERISQKDSALQQLTEKFNKTSEQLNILYVEVSALKENENDIIMLKETIREKEETLVVLKETVISREENLAVLQQSMAEHEESMNSSREAQNLSVAEGDEVKSLQSVINNLKEEINQKHQSLSQISESCGALTEENTRLKSIEQERYELVAKFNQTTNDLAAMTEENRQLKEAENEIASLAQQIPVLSQEMQRLGQENKELKEKEGEMYRILEQMKERETILGNLNQENSRLKEESEASKQRLEEHVFLSQQVQGLETRLLRAEKESSELQKSSENISSETAELQRKEVQQYEVRIRELNDLLEEKDLHLKQLSCDVESFSGQVSSLTETNASLTEHLQTGKTELEAALSQLSDTKQELTQKGASLLDTQKLMTGLQENIIGLEGENKELKEKQNELLVLQNKIHSLEKEHDRLRASVASKETHLSELNMELNNLNSERTLLNEEISRSKTNIDRLKLELEQSNLSLVELNVKIQTLAENHSELEIENRALKAQVTDYEQLKQTAGNVEEKDNIILDIKEKLRCKQVEYETVQKENTQYINTVKEMEDGMSSLSQQVESLTSQLSEKDRINLQLKESLQSQQSKEQDWLRKTSSVTEELEATTSTLTEKDAVIAELSESLGKYTPEIKSLKESLELAVGAKNEMEITVENFKCDLQALKAENGELLGKVDIGLKAQEEVGILQLSLMERDEKLVSLTESIGCLREEITQLNSINELLSAREKELANVQNQVQGQLQMVNNDIFTLKAENEKLGEKEKELVEKEHELVALKENFAVVEAECNTLLQKVEEFNHMVSEYDLISAKVSALELEKNELALQVERMNEVQADFSNVKLKNEGLEKEIVMLKQSHDNMTKSQEDQTADLHSTIEKLSNEINDFQIENAGLKEYQSEVVELREKLSLLQDERYRTNNVSPTYEKLSEENKALKEQLNEALKVGLENPDIVAIEQAEVGSSPAQSDVEHMQVSPSRSESLDNPPESRNTEESMVVPSALEMVEAALQNNDEAVQLRNLVTERDQAIITLHQTVQVQQQSLQEIHQKLTEYSQYATALSQENQQLKSQIPNAQAMETDSPKMVNVAHVSSEVSSVDGTQKSSPSKQESAVKNQLEERQVMVQELTNQVQVLADENHSLKSQLDSRAREQETATPESAIGSESTNVTDLHNYIYQQKQHMEQMSQRIVELTNYISQVQEQNTALREKDAASTEMIQNLAKDQEKFAQDKQELERRHSQEKEELVRASHSITSLQEENKKLRQTEKETSEVVQHLMSDLEERKRRESDTPSHSSREGSPTASPSVGNTVGRSEHNQALEALRAELEEQHGEQIVAMKHQLRQQLNYSMEEMLNAITAERDEARTQLEVLRNELEMKNEETTQEQRAFFSHEEMESLHLEIQQLQIKLRDFEDERSEYVNKIQNQHKKHSSELQNTMQMKSQTESKLFETLNELELLKKEHKESRDTSEKSKGIYAEEIQNLNQMVLQLSAERDDAHRSIEALEKSNQQILDQNKSVPEPQIDHTAQVQVAEMNKQLQKLAKERDEALVHIQKQQEQLQTQKDAQPDQSLLHQQVGEALRHEIDLLNVQLQEVTTAKEEAFSKIRELEFQVQGHQAAQTALPDTPEKNSLSSSSSRKNTPSKSLSPMQQHLLHLQQQIAQEGPGISDTVDKSESPNSSPSNGMPCRDSPEKSETNTDALRLAQIQAIYDEHCKHQAHQIEKLTAELQRTVREKDETNSQLEHYQKHYESHLQKIANKHKLEAKEEVDKSNEELRGIKKSRDDLQLKIDTVQTQYKSQISEITEQMKSWQSKYQDLSQQLSGDISVETAHLRSENQQLRDALQETKLKFNSSEKEKEEAQAKVKELQIFLYDMEGKDPNVASYRTRLEDIESTLKVTWIENEELKSEVAALKSNLRPEELAAHLQCGKGADSPEDIDILKARLVAAEAELEKIQPLVSIEVIVLTRQIEELKQTYSHQLRVHNQELVAVKRELARYQNLDSDSSESPIHAQKAEKLGTSGKGESVDSDSLSIELGRFQAEHLLEVEGLKRTKSEVSVELNDEKERHRDAMSRIEQLLKKLVSMQQKHRKEIETLSKSHEETVERMTIEMEQVRLINLNQTSAGVNSPQLDTHLERLVSEKQKLLSEKHLLQQEKRDWDHERERLKGRIAQIVGEKDLLTKDLSKDNEKAPKDQQDLDTQMRVLTAEKQYVQVEREELAYMRLEGNEFGRKSEGSSKVEEAHVRKIEEQVTLLEQERVLLVNDHKEELKVLTDETKELKIKLDELKTEKETLKEQLGFEISELLLKIESLEHGSPTNSKDVDRLLKEIETLKEEKLEIVKELQADTISKMADWKLEREQLEEQFKSKVADLQQGQNEDKLKEVDELKVRFSDVSSECEDVKKERDELKSNREQVMEALKSQEAEIIKLQTACGRIKEERDKLQHEHMKMLDAIQAEGSDVVSQLTQQIQEITDHRKVLKEEQALALENLQAEFHQQRLDSDRQLQETTMKHEHELQEHAARLEAELGVYKQKHSEVLDEVHTLRRENYEMRTMLSDHVNSPTSPVFESHQGHPIQEPMRSIQADSLSPDSGGVSEPERDYLRAKEDYEQKQAELNEKYQNLRQERDSLSEHLEVSQRRMKFEYEYDLQTQAKKLKEDSIREIERQMKIAKIENDRKFVQELQKVRQQLRGDYESQVNALTRQLAGEAGDQKAADVLNKAQSKELEDAHEQITISHCHQEELEQEVRDISSQNEALSTEIINLQQHIAGLNNAQAFTDQTDSLDSKSKSESTYSASEQSSEYSELLDKYSKLLNDHQSLVQKLGRDSRSRTKTPSAAGSYTDSLDDRLSPNKESLHEELVVVKGENNDLRENMTELMDKYIQVVADNEGLRGKHVEYMNQDSLEDMSSLSVVGGDAVEASRLQARYDTIAEQNEVLRAQLGSYGLPTESVAEEEETLDLKSRYELIMKENETLRTKLEAYTHQGSVERDGRWKEKYEAILHDYAVLRSQLEELGLPINDSIQKGLEELQVKFDQVVKEKETLQVKLCTVRENAEQDFRELQARHSDLNSMHNTLAADHVELKNILAKDKDKSKREYVKIKNKLSNIAKESDEFRNKLSKASKEVETLKVKLEEAEAKLKQEAAVGQAPTTKGKKRKQDRGAHSRGRKQRRESETLDDSIEMADQNLQEELGALKLRYTSVVKENDSLQYEVGSLKSELGSLKARLIDNLRHRLRGPPIAQSTPYDLGIVDMDGIENERDVNQGTPTGRPSADHIASARLVDFGSNNSSSDLDLTSPADVETLRQRYEKALQDLGDLRNELDRMNSQALDELMGLPSESDSVEEKPSTTNQTKNAKSKKKEDTKAYQQLQLRYNNSQEELRALKKRLQEVIKENNQLQLLNKSNLGDAANGDYATFKEDLRRLATTKGAVQSDTDIEAETAQLAQMTVARDGTVRKELTSQTVSLGNIDVDVMVDSLPVDVEKSHSLTSVLPRSVLEGGKMEAEWRRMLRMRSRATSIGEPIYEEGFHPEAGSKFAGFIPDTDSLTTQLMWSSGSHKSDQSDLQLMPIEEEFKLQLEAMVANFGEKNVREQLGRDYVEMHQRCEAIHEENESLQVELSDCRERILKISKEVIDAGKEFHPLVPDMSEDSEMFSQDGEEENYRQLRLDIKRLKDENQLLLRENAEIEAKYSPKKSKLSNDSSYIGNETDLQHLKQDKDSLEDEVAKIISFYIQVQSEKEKAPGDNEQCEESQRYDDELVVLTSVLNALKQEQLKVETQLKERLGQKEPTDESVKSEALCIPFLHAELKKLQDENQLLIQDNALLTAKYESRIARAALDDSVTNAEIGDEMEHLKRDKAYLEEEVSKIRSLYLQVNEEKEKLSMENEELYGSKDRLERELQVLRTLLDTLRQEQKRVETQIEARSETDDAATEKGDVEESKVRKGKKVTRKSPISSIQAVKAGTQSATLGKKATKNPASSSESTGSKAGQGKDSTRGSSPLKMGKEPPKKSKKVSQTQLYASGESLATEERVGGAQLGRKVKELTTKNKSLILDIDKLRKDLNSADRSKDIAKLQKDNKALLQELEEMRGSLQSQAKLMDQIQDLRGRIEALSKEKDTLKKENQLFSDRINDEVSPPMLEHEDLKAENAELVKKNRSLMEKLDRDLMQAEHELAEMRENYKMTQTQKEDIEDEYKTFKERCEKELYNLQSRYDEVVEERDLLEGQLINTKEHAEKEYQQLQAGYEEIRNDYEELQKASNSDKERWRKEVHEIKVKLESTKVDNEELKYEVADARENVEHEKNNLQQHCAMLQEEKHNFNREIKDLQNRLIAAEKAKDDIEKQKKDIAAQFDSVERYYDEMKASLEEENQLLRNKVGSLQEEYDQLSDSVKELKMEKFSMAEELSESRAWCETLEMNLKETETSMSKENYTLKEELRFISEKLETETYVKSSIASAEEDLRQKLIQTSQVLSSLKQEAAASKEKMVAKIENLLAENGELMQQLEKLKMDMIEKESTKEACKIELTTLQDTYNQLLKDFEEIKSNKYAIEKEYRQIRDQYGITETQLSEFRRSVLTENVESEKLISKFRVQFEQVTKERNDLQTEKESILQQVQEAKAKYIVQKEDNRVLRCAMGVEVDLRFQNVSQIESLLGEEAPPLSPISPLSPSPAPSECGSESSEDTGTASEALIAKLHRQNTSLALLIENLAQIKIAKDNQVTSLVERCNILQASLDESILLQDKSHTELAENVNSDIQSRLQETEAKLQEMIDRCRVLEGELLRLQKEPADVGILKCREKYVVEMEEDLLTVSTVVMADEEEQGSLDGSPSVISSVDKDSPEGAMTSTKSKTWQAEYLALQDKYMNLLQEHEHIWRRVRGEPSPVHGDTELSGELTIEITDSSVIELIADNSKLQAERTRLEGELMSQRIDRIEVEAVYTEMTWLKEQRTKYEKKLKLQHNMYEKEKQLLEERLGELRDNLDKLLSAKSKTEEDLRLLKRKYNDLFSLCSKEVKAMAEEIQDDDEREKIMAMVASEACLRDLEQQLKSEIDEKEYLRVQIAHLKKEGELYDRHVQDLEKEIEAQYTHLHAASREHKTMVRLLAETKLELELNREKHKEFTKIGETVERIESQLSGRSTPQYAMMHSPPIPASSGTTSPSMGSAELAPEEAPNSEQHRLFETSRIVEEMMQLRQEIVEAKSMYTHGNTLLKQAQLQNKIKSEHTTIKVELSVVEEQNKLLKNENEELQKRLAEQEEYVFHVQAQLSSASTDDGKNNLEAVFSQQLELLKSQRDSLQVKLLTLDELQYNHMALLKEKSILEEKYEQELEMVRQKLLSKEMNELELIRKIAALEQHIREQQRLEELIYHKLRLQDDIQRQKESFDIELDDVEKTLQERRNIMKNERVMLLGELKQKYWQRILRQDGSSEGDPVLHSVHKENPKHIAAGFERLSRMKLEVESRYKEAIERLRKELHEENERTSRNSSPTHQ